MSKPMFSFLRGHVPQLLALLVVISTSLAGAAEIDWRKKGVLNPVRKIDFTGNCTGISYAMATVDAVEAAIAIRTKKLPLLSEQELIDCSRTYNNKGCVSGTALNTLKYIADNGIMTSADYPSTNISNACARRTDVTAPYKIKSHVVLTNAVEMEAALSKGPFIACIYMARDWHNWKTYQSGIIHRCFEGCSHWVTVIGVSENSWIIRNTFGESWSYLKGYARVATTEKCNTTLSMNAYQPVV